MGMIKASHEGHGQRAGISYWNGNFTRGVFINMYCTTLSTFLRGFKTQYAFLSHHHSPDLQTL